MEMVQTIDTLIKEGVISRKVQFAKFYEDAKLA